MSEVADPHEAVKRAGKLMEGKKVFDAARDEYAPTFAAAVEELADEVIRKI